MEEFAGDLRNHRGVILASWFLANPNGPTAFALGYAELESSSAIFYRWMHFMGGRTWLVTDLDTERGNILLNAILLLNNEFAATGKETPLFASIPNAVVTNGNSKIGEELAKAIRLATRDHDWGREVYYVLKYRNDFFVRLEEEVREFYEHQRARPDADSEFLKNFWLGHRHLPGFVEWEPGRYQSSGLTDELFNAWWPVVTDENFLHPSALYHFAEMWVGSTEQSGLKESLISEGRYQPLKEALECFDQFRQPLMPSYITEDQIRKNMGLKTT